MGESAQTVFNVLISLSAFLGGWVLNSLTASIRQLQKDDKELAEKLQSIEVLIAGDYVKTSTLQATLTALFTKLDRIETKIDGKADKQ